MVVLQRIKMCQRGQCVCVCEWVEVELSYPLQVLVLNMWQRRRPPRGRSRSFPPCPELHSGQELLCVLPLGSSSILLELPCLSGGPRPGALAHGWAHLGHLGGGGRQSGDFTGRVQNNTHTQTHAHKQTC